MQRFSTWARWIATVIFIPILIGVATGVAVDLIKQQPRETANVVLKFLVDLSEQTWLRLTALSLGCFVAGLWVDWLLRKLDGSRAKERKKLGAEMVELGNRLRDMKYPTDIVRPQIMSYFAAVRRVGIWAPDDQYF